MRIPSNGRRHRSDVLQLVGLELGGGDVVGGYHGAPPNGDEELLVYVATRPTTV